MKIKIVQYLRLLFCLCFFLFCLVPMLILDEMEVSEQENRTLAVRPSLVENKKLNKQFDKQYENYLKDHFPNRWGFIKFYYYLQYSILSRIENNEAFIGDDGWMFSFYHTRDKKLSTEKWVVNHALEKAESFLDYIHTKPIDVYFFLVPDRTQIYHQYWDKHYANRPSLYRGEELKKSLSKHSNVYVFYPFEQLSLLSKQQDVFLKHDIHLYGKTGLQPLMDTFLEILQKRYFPKVTEYSKIKYGQDTQGIDVNAHFAALLFLDMKRKMTSFEPIRGEYLSVEDNLYNNMTMTTVNLEAPSDKSVLVIGNCYAESVFAQMRELFSKAFLYRYNTNKRISSSQKLSLNDIDVIIIAVAEDNMDNLDFLDTVRNML